MTYSVATNTTFYLVVAPDDGIWFSFLEKINLGNVRDDRSLLSASELVSSPYLVHALVASLVFEQATEYGSIVRSHLAAEVSRLFA